MGGYDKFGVATTALMRHYGWGTVVMAIDESSVLCLYGANGIQDSFKVRVGDARSFFGSTSKILQLSPTQLF